MSDSIREHLIRRRGIKIYMTARCVVLPLTMTCSGSAMIPSQTLAHHQRKTPTASAEDDSNNKARRINALIMQQSHQHLRSGDVVADINYFPALGTPIPKSAWKTRYLDDNDELTRSMIIRDIRSSTKRFYLDTQGFEYVQLPPKQRVSRNDDEEVVKCEYYPELESIAKALYKSILHITQHIF
jgi:hypothetical protein